MFLALALCFLVSCTQKKTENNAAKEKTADELKVGGLYAMKAKSGEYYIAKILVLESDIVHARNYGNKFDTPPNDISSDTLEFMIGHAPISLNGFLLDKPQLIKIEKVREDELEGYKIYLEAMSK